MAEEVKGEVLEKSGGDSTVSFDEIEEAILPNKTLVEDDDELPNQTDKNLEKVKDVLKKGDAKEPKSKDKPTTKKNKEKEDEDEKEEQKGDKESVEEEAEKAAKKIRAKSGEDELELSQDVTFEVPIRGVKEKVTLQDLMSNYSGKTDWSQKYKDLNKDKQTFERDRDTLQKYVNDLHTKLVDEKDAMGALWMLAEAMGGSPAKVISEFQKQIMGKLDEWKDLSEEQRRVKELEEQLALRSRQDELTTRAKQAQAVEDEMRGRVEKVIQDNGMDKEGFFELYTKLKSSGTLKTEELTPERVAEEFKKLESEKSIESLLDDVNPDIENKAEAVTEMKKVLATYPDFTIEDLRDIAVEVYGSKSSKNLSRKLKKSAPAETAKERVASGDAWSFDQI